MIPSSRANFPSSQSWVNTSRTFFLSQFISNRVSTLSTSSNSSAGNASINSCSTGHFCSCKKSNRLTHSGISPPYPVFPIPMFVPTSTFFNCPKTALLLTKLSSTSNPSFRFKRDCHFTRNILRHAILQDNLHETSKFYHIYTYE
jgi:hypothetical protein